LSPPARSLLAALALLICSACDDRCSLLNCKTLYEDCGATLKAEPNYARCGLTRTDADPLEEGNDGPTYRCAQACVASNTGEALECISDDSRMCRDGRAASLLNTCDGRRTQPKANCTPKCDEARTTCEAKCPMVSGPDAGTKSDCLDCVARCGLAWGRCDAACRSDS
jgi:hypothetical protein